MNTHAVRKTFAALNLVVMGLIIATCFAHGFPEPGWDAVLMGILWTALTGSAVLLWNSPSSGAKSLLGLWFERKRLEEEKRIGGLRQSSSALSDTSKS